MSESYPSLLFIFSLLSSHLLSLFLPSPPLPTLPLFSLLLPTCSLPFFPSLLLLSQPSNAKLQIPYVTITNLQGLK
jgi:hypothetical protein